MKILLDTHVLLWVVTGSDRLPATAVQAYQNPDNELFVSAASFWEIGIKISLGKLTLTSDGWTGVLCREMETNGIRRLPIEPGHCARVARLPFHHRDPFDRLLAAQALEDGMAMMTADSALAAYGVEIVWE